MEQANETSSDDSVSTTKMSGGASARQVINDLSSSVWAFSALACALETGLLEALSESGSLADLSHRSGIPTPLVEGMLDVLVALGLLQRDGNVYSGVPGLLPLLQAPFRDPLLADVRSAYLQSRAMIDAAKRRTLTGGWYHTDPELLAAQGTPGGLLFYMLAQMLFPQIEDLADREAFDLIWLPQIFLPREVLERGLRRAWAALRPGGWILLIAYSTPGMDLDAALGRLMNVLWGGDPLYPEQVAELLAAAAFARDDPQADRGPTTGVLNYLIDLVLYESLSTKNEVDEFVASRHTKSGKSWFVGALAQINTE